MKKPIDLEKLKAFVELGAKGEITNVDYIYNSVPQLISLLKQAKELVECNTCPECEQSVLDFKNSFKKEQE